MNGHRLRTFAAAALLLLSGCLPYSCRRQESTALTPADSLSRALALSIPMDTLSLAWTRSIGDERGDAYPRTVRFGPAQNGPVYLGDAEQALVFVFDPGGAHRSTPLPRHLFPTSPAYMKTRWRSSNRKHRPCTFLSAARRQEPSRYRIRNARKPRWCTAPSGAMPETAPSTTSASTRRPEGSSPGSTHPVTQRPASLCPGRTGGMRACSGSGAIRS